MTGHHSMQWETHRTFSFLNHHHTVRDSSNMKTWMTSKTNWISQTTGING